MSQTTTEGKNLNITMPSSTATRSTDGGKTPEILSLKLQTAKMNTDSSMEKATIAIFKQQASIYMYVATFSALLGAIGFGLGIGWSAPAFESMNHEDSIPHLDESRDKEILSWIGSSLTLSALFGALLSGFIVQKYGRRLSLIGYGLPFTLGWICIIFATDGYLLLVGRIILGLAIGALSGTAPAYVVDISTIKIRGMLGALFQFFIVTGILIGYTIGAHFYWRIASIISMFPTILLSIMMYFMPEGPNWLVLKKRYEEATESLKKIRSSKSEVDKELETLINISKATKQNEFRYSLYFQRRHFIPLTYSLGLMLFQQFCGVNAVMFYSTAILKESGSTITASLGTIMIGVAQCLATGLGTGLVDYTGRKVLLIVSGTLHVVSMTVFAIYYTLSNSDSEEPSMFGWIPVVSMIVFIIGFSLGWGPIPWLMVAEITPNESKSATSAISTCSNWMGAFIVTKTFKQLQDALTKPGVFYLFAAFSLLSILFTIFFLPETKNKSYEEIRQIFEPKRLKSSFKSTSESQTGGSESI